MQADHGAQHRHSAIGRGPVQRSVARVRVGHQPLGAESLVRGERGHRSRPVLRCGHKQRGASGLRSHGATSGGGACSVARARQGRGGRARCQQASNAFCFFFICRAAVARAAGARRSAGRALALARLEAQGIGSQGQGPADWGMLTGSRSSGSAPSSSSTCIARRLPQPAATMRAVKLSCGAAASQSAPSVGGLGGGGRRGSGEARLCSAEPVQIKFSLPPAGTQPALGSPPRAAAPALRVPRAAPPKRARKHPGAGAPLRAFVSPRPPSKLLAHRS